MHRIDSSTATPDGRFTEGNPTIPVPATTVTAEWLNSVQEELVAILTAAGIVPNKASNVQVLSAILDLIADSTPLAKVGTPGLVMPDGTTIRIDGSGKISAIMQSMDPVGGIRFFEDEMPRAGYVECNAGVVANFSTTYPQMVAYLETPYGQSRLVTLAEYESLHVAVWHTNADGSKVSWNGIGGVAKFVWDKAADTLKMPDLQDMFRGARGPSLGVGGVHGDQGREATGYTALHTTAGSLSIETKSNGVFAAEAWGYGSSSGTQQVTDGFGIRFRLSRVMPVGSAFTPRAWGALACCYLGTPAG
jgi:hypothetical protein